MGKSRFPNHAKAPSAMRGAMDRRHTIPRSDPRSSVGVPRTLRSLKRNVPSYTPFRGHPSSVPPFRGVSSNHPLCGW